jgi:hypothetical protein
MHRESEKKMTFRKKRIDELLWLLTLPSLVSVSGAVEL